MHQKLPRNGKPPLIIEFKRMETNQEPPNKKLCLRRNDESMPALERMAEALMALKSRSFDDTDHDGKSPLQKPQIGRNMMLNSEEFSSFVPTVIAPKRDQSDIARLKRCLSKIMLHPRKKQEISLKKQAYEFGGQPMPPPPRLLKRSWGETA
mmetsp:Transcript_14441/g.22565  ORF Transcript_14441/g.22565 Transcript_14441/m.22565 type:complete len:152 (-) Transcript_14441:350-805(-)